MHYLLLFLLIAQFQFKIPLVKKLLGKEVQLPDKVWNTLNLGWALFFYYLYVGKYLY